MGSWFEVTNNGAITKYYYFGAQRVAVRTSAGVTYLHTDHLGSTSVASNANGALIARQTYYAYGTTRTSDGALPTDYTFTGQKSDSDGLMYYGARYYDAAIGRFTQPDSIIPDQFNPPDLNRYTYVYNNPIRHTDPTGHCAIVGCIAAVLASPAGLALLGGAALIATYELGWAPNARENQQTLSNAIANVIDSMGKVKVNTNPDVAVQWTADGANANNYPGGMPPIKPSGLMEKIVLGTAIVGTGAAITEFLISGQDPSSPTELFPEYKIPKGHIKDPESGLSGKPEAPVGNDLFTGHQSSIEKQDPIIDYTPVYNDTVTSTMW